MTSKLALLGGDPIRRAPFAPRITMGAAEKAAVLAVMDSQCLSGFFGSAGPAFLGGPQVRGFEQAWAERFGYKHAVTVNSWTSGLMTAIGAAGLGPGDEIICPPFTMSASATAAFFYGAIPVFVDVEATTFNLDPVLVEKAITNRTKAIMAVHIFGLPADMDRLTEIANRRRLTLIEDAAQAPGATVNGRLVGALKDIGGFSLNYHKHIHTGEGGILVTDRDDLAVRCQMIRNHGENLLEGYRGSDHSNLVGGNYRLTELQAAIGLAQLNRLGDIIAQRQALAEHLAKRLDGVDIIAVPPVPRGRTHAYYIYPLLYRESVDGITRERFVAAVNAELPAPTGADDVALRPGYVKPLYLNPIYQKKMAIGREGFPFTANPNVRYDYPVGLCPVAERLHDRDILLSSLVRDPLNDRDVDDFADAIVKVSENIDDLRT